MSAEILEQAIASTRGVLANVSKEQLAHETPCADWKIHDLINHIVGGQFWFAAAMNGENPAGGDTDFASTDFLSTFTDASTQTLTAFRADGAMERELSLPFGTMSGSAFLGLAATDTFTHAWDLAKATGQDTDLDPALAATLLEGARQMVQPGFRNEAGNPFGPEKTAPPGSSNADKLAAFLGRNV
jgi:uncharacterized protein (TIGR03086 family)